MALRARKVSGALEKRAPGVLSQASFTRTRSPVENDTVSKSLYGTYQNVYVRGLPYSLREPAKFAPDRF